jgi:hypothetical protein
MLGSGASRLSVAPGGALAGPWVRNPLWRNARAVPSLDLDFAGQKSLKDGISSQDLITFTRASSATYTDSAGVLRSSVTNLLLRSEEFETTWTSTALLAFGSGSITNAIAAPNGTITADKIVEDTTTSTHNVSQSYTASIAVVPHTISFYVKAAERTAVSIWFRGTSSGNRYEVGFNLANGTVRGSSLQGNFTSGAESIQSVGNGWFHCTATATPGASETSMRLTIFLNNSPSLSTNNPSYTGDGTSGIYLWGAQLEQASTVGEYIPTTSTINSAPRFDHNPTTGESLGLMGEEARTNLCLQSEDFSTTWTKVAATVTTDAIVSPSGALNADKLVETTANSTHYAVQSVSVTTTSRTASIYLKAGERTQARIEHSGNTGGAARRITINLSTGAITGASTIGTGGLNSFSESIVSVGNGWYRVISTIDPTVTLGNTQALVIQILDNTGQATYVGDGTSGIYLWGAQLEAGAFPTSYIPTTTATVTRAADVASITGSNFSSWYNQTEGTVFGEGRRLTNEPYFRMFSLNNGSSSNVLSMYTDNGPRFSGFKKVNNGSDNYFLGPAVATLTANLKTCLSSNSSNSTVSTSGAFIETSISGMPTVDRFTIGAEWYGAPYNGTIKRLTYWPTRLANTTLQQITQP